MAIKHEALQNSHSEACEMGLLDPSMCGFDFFVFDLVAKMSRGWRSTYSRAVVFGGEGADVDELEEIS